MNKEHKSKCKGHKTKYKAYKEIALFIVIMLVSLVCAIGKYENTSLASEISIVEKIMYNIITFTSIGLTLIILWKYSINIKLSYICYIINTLLSIIQYKIFYGFKEAIAVHLIELLVSFTILIMFIIDSIRKNNKQIIKNNITSTNLITKLIIILITYTIVMIQYNSKEYEIMSYSTNQKMLVSLYVTLPIAINILMITMSDMFYIMNFIYEAVLIYALYLQISLDELEIQGLIYVASLIVFSIFGYIKWLIKEKHKAGKNKQEKT